MRIIEKGILEMTGVETTKCKSLSLRHQGLMCEDLVDWKTFERSDNKMRRKSRVWMMFDDNDRLLSWALVTPRWKETGYDAQLYTRISERGKGYAGILMKRVLEYTPTPHVFPHDRMSGEFFKKHRDSIRYDKCNKGWIE